MTATTTTTATAFRAYPLHSFHPEPFKGLMAMAMASNEAAQAAGIPEGTMHLVRIRASQLNGCANCLRMHVREALEHGESTDRLALVSAWRDAAYFTPEEQAALTIAEDVTLIADTHTRAHTNREAYAPLTDAQIAAVQWGALVINAFNRLAVAGHTVVAP